MLLVVFPITDPIRKYLLLMEWIIVFISIELGVIFLIRYYNSKKTKKNPQELSYAALILSYAAEWFFFIISDFYALDAYYRAIFLNIGYFSLYFGALIFVYVMERYYIFYKKNLFTFIFLLLNIGFLIVLSIDMYATQTFSALPWPFFVVFLTAYFIKLAKKAPKKMHYGLIFFKFFAGFLLLGIGYTFTTDFFTSNFGLNARIYGDFVQVMAIFVIYIFFSAIPPLSEFDWLDKIESIYLIHNSGVPIFSKSFRAGDDKIMDTLIPGALTSVKMMLKEITHKKEMSVIKKGESITIIYPSDQITGVIIAKEDLFSLQSLLKVFTERVQGVYADVIKSWNQDMHVFKPVMEIYESIFSYH